MGVVARIWVHGALERSNNLFIVLALTFQHELLVWTLPSGINYTSFSQTWGQFQYR
jgi:hypothetical protein